MLIIVFGFFSPAIAASYSNSNANNNNLWDTLRYSFQLEGQYQRPEVQTQVDWLMHHQKYLDQLSEHSQPYLYYILQEIKRRHMPGELALLPMIESTYNPFAYSPSGAAGLWQFTSGSGANFGLKQNHWFDGRRDIYNSTNAALNYLSYLHRFFNGNWMLAIAAYHSGEGTVQNAVKYNDHHQRSTNFWALNLPQDTQNYLPKLLALARLIQSKNALSSKLPYISNTPYFTQVDVGTQIDLTNAAHLAGISYPEFLKLNPGSNHWTTPPQGPHTIVLPLDKVDVFVRNLEKIPESHRSNTLAKHAVHFDFDPDLAIIPEEAEEPIEEKVDNNLDEKINAQITNNTQHSTAGLHKVLHLVQRGDSFAQLAQKYHVSEADIRSWNNISSQDHLKQNQKLTIWTPNHVNWGHTSKTIYYTIKSGDSLIGIAKKYHVSVKTLTSWNPNVPPNHLVPGKKIVINN